MEAPVFTCDVFLSHTAKDKAVVRPLAERLRKDGLKVWFDEWALKPGDLNQEARSSRRESAQLFVRPEDNMSGLTSAATREEEIAEGLEHSMFGTRNCAALHVGECVLRNQAGVPALPDA